jgi:hypothetical protein
MKVKSFMYDPETNVRVQLGLVQRTENSGCKNAKIAGENNADSIIYAVLCRKNKY